MKFSVAIDDHVLRLEVPGWGVVGLLALALLWHPVDSLASDGFPDVGDGHPFHDEIGWMAATGISDGYDDGTFRPSANVTRQAMAAFMHRLAGADAAVEPMVNAAQLAGSDGAALVAQVEALRDELDALQATLAGVSRDGDVLTFEGMNVQVVDGSGSTAGATNGLGNLIIGYNEQFSGRDTSGSHNIVSGIDNGYSSYGGLVVGQDNRIAGAFATVTGGNWNTASGAFASVSGGLSNTASGEYSSVSGGGNGNVATGLYSSVSGGIGNVASGPGASVSGGGGNAATLGASSVSGGDGNTAAGYASSVLGGQGNVAAGGMSSVSGGATGQANGPNSSVSGGIANVADGDWSTVSGGFARSVDGLYDWRAGTLFDEG